MPLDAQGLLGSAVAVVALIGAVAAWVKWLHPKARQAEAVGEAILGREAVKDRSGAVIQPAQPGMVAQVSALTEAVRKLADMHQRVDGVEAEQVKLRNEIAGVDGRVKALEDARIEHVVSRAESAAAFSAIEAAVKATPED